MKRDHNIFLSLEKHRLEDPDAKTLWEDIIFLRSSPVRCLYELYRRDGYAPTSEPGKKLMCGLLICMESNKSVEDIHQPIRMDAKANQNIKMSSNHIQELIIHSRALESRSVHHGAAVTKESQP